MTIIFSILTGLAAYEVLYFLAYESSLSIILAIGFACNAYIAYKLEQKGSL